MSEPEFSPTTETEYGRLPQVYRDADEDQVYPLRIKGVEERFNYAPNPSFEIGGGSSVSAINEIVNPSFEGNTTGNIELYQNIVTNPKGKTKGLGTVDVRTNLVNRSLITGNSSTIIQLKADQTSTWDIATPGNANGGQIRIPVPTSLLKNGHAYTASVEVRNIYVVPMELSFSWGANGEPEKYSLAPNKTMRISTTGIESIYTSSSSVAILNFSSSVNALQFRNAMIENAGSALPYFDGDIGIGDSDLLPVWKGAPGNSVSALTGVAVKGWSGVNGVVYWAPSIGKAKLFVPFAGNAGARAESDGEFDHRPLTAMARPHTTDGTEWLAKFDGAYPYPDFKDPAGDTITELQYPVVGGSTPPVESYVGQYWVNNQNTPYRRIQ